MISSDQLGALQGKTLLGASGDKLGRIDALYADRTDGEPTFATVHTGLFGAKTHFVPLAQAELRGDDVVVPYDKDLVSSAPALDPDTDLSPEEEQRLYAHYGLGGGTTATSGTETASFAGAGHDTSGPNTDDAMTRSEERLTAGTQKVEAGRARLRKYIVTDTETVQVPVSREEGRIEREPITDANAGAAYSGKEISEEEHEVTLHAERPVVGTEAVAVERVRLDKEVVTDTETVSGEVRKEQIELDDPTGTARDPRS